MPNGFQKKWKGGKVNAEGDRLFDPLFLFKIKHAKRLYYIPAGWVNGDSNRKRPRSRELAWRLSEGWLEPCGILLWLPRETTPPQRRA